VRAGLIVGPHDPTGRFTHWPHRIARGGDVLVPGSLDRPVQLVDVRDLAAWMIDIAANGPTGAFNVTASHTMRDVFDAAVSVTGSDAAAVEVDEPFLVEHEVGQWMELPLWVDTSDPEWGCLMRADTARADGAGFRARALEDTVRATLDHAALVDGVGLTTEREAELLASWWSTPKR
jgi:2'-hydroxyisoflavone reductase